MTDTEGKARVPRRKKKNPEEIVTSAEIVEETRHRADVMLRYADGETARVSKDSAEYKVLLAERILAQRMLARRRLLPFIQMFNPAYEVGWCHEVLAAKLEKFVDDCANKRSPRLMITFPPRHGKQLADSTPVLTTTGWKTHGELEVGDYVFHPSGRPVQVLAVSDKTPSDWVVELSNGEAIRCHERHEWTIYDRPRRVVRTVETGWFRREVAPGKQATVMSGGRCSYQLPPVSALQYPEAELLMHPYVLGAWLGDGSRGKGCVSLAPADIAVAEQIEQLGYERSASCVHKDTGVVTTYFSGPRPGVLGRMLSELRQLGVTPRKHIPECYLRSSVQQRLELLAGLVDTDGHCDGNGRMRFTTADYDLACGVLDLCTTLGFRPYITTTQPSLSSSGIQGRVPYYVVGWQPTMDIPCVLERKRPQRLAPQRAVGVVDVRYEPNGEVGHCITVDSEDGLYLAGYKLIPTHNSEQTSRKLPAYILGHYPWMEIILASYGISLAEQFSKHVIQLLKDERYAQLFPNTQLHPDDQAMSGWRTTEGGGFKPAGVGVGVTGMGAHCFPAGTPVLTDKGYIAIERLQPGVMVYTCDVETGKLGFCPVEATHSHVTSYRLIEITTASGKRVRATPDHRFYVPTVGWIEAADLRPGHPIAILEGGNTLHSLSAASAAYSGRDSKGSGEGITLHGMRQEVRGGWAAEDSGMRGLRGGIHAPTARTSIMVLHPGMPETTRVQAAAPSTALGLPAMWYTIPAQEPPYAILLSRLRECGPRSPYARDWELKLQGWDKLREVVQVNATADSGARQMLSGMRGDSATVYTSHQRGQDGQHAGELSNSMQVVPHHAPQIVCDTISSVVAVGEAGECVYDIQVEGTHCFFADDFCSHNCLIIDDPFKDRAEANSDTIRASTWDWYTDVALTRLAPGGGVLIINTRWHDDDLSGRLLAMADDPESSEYIDKWDLVNFAAIADEDEYLTLDHRLVNEPVEGAKLVRHAGEALHPDRYPLDLLLRIKATMTPQSWNALYQQKPVPDDGEFFHRDQIAEYDPADGREDGTAYIACDFAITEKQTADWTVIAVGIHMPNDTVHVDDIHRFRSGDAFKIVDTLLNIFIKYQRLNPILGVEDGQIWRSMSALFFAEARRRGLYPSVELLKPLTEKQARARPLQGRMQMHMMTFQKGAPWLTKMTEELLRFPSGVHDDIVDALAWMMQLVVTKTPPKPLLARRRASPTGWQNAKTVQERILEHARKSGSSHNFMAS
mgnify:CR=1 FL=1